MDIAGTALHSYNITISKFEVLAWLSSELTKLGEPNQTIPNWLVLEPRGTGPRFLGLYLDG